MERINTPPTFTDLTLAGLGGRRAAEFFARCRRRVQLTGAGVCRYSTGRRNEALDQGFANAQAPPSPEDRLKEAPREVEGSSSHSMMAVGPLFRAGCSPTDRLAREMRLSFFLMERPARGWKVRDKESGISLKSQARRRHSLLTPHKDTLFS